LRAVSNENGDVVKEIVYDTFGNILDDSNPSFKVPFGFAGGLYDRDTKLIHFGFREYDPFIGRWTAKDPILFNGGDSNLYGYVLGDPVSGVDVLGLSKTKGILDGNDPFLEKLKCTRGDRKKIKIIEDEIIQLKKEGKIKPARWKKLKAWLKIAKDGRLFSIWDFIQYSIRI